MNRAAGRRCSQPVLLALAIPGYLAGQAARRPVAGPAASVPDSSGVLTYHNDPARTGQNLRETILTPATVTPDRFGLLQTDFHLDGKALAQPLYVPDVSINGSSYDIVIVVTEHDTVYAFDADFDQHPQNGATPLWVRSLLTAGASPVPAVDQQDPTGFVCEDIEPEIGITGTPVVDPAAGILYVAAKSKEPDGSYAFRLHALDLANGLDDLALGSPVRVDAGDFNALRGNQRAGLALAEGVVYVAFASLCDQTPFHGWLFGYDTTNRLQRVVAFKTTPGHDFGGIWMSGGAPAVDTDATMFLSVGNGRYDPFHGLWGDSILKLPVDREALQQPGRFRVRDFFTPFNQDFLYLNDIDLGSAGPMLVPAQPGSTRRLLVTSGKQGLVYVLDRSLLTTGNRHQGQCRDDDLLALRQAQEDAPTRSYTETCDPVIQAFRIVVGTDPDLPSVYTGTGVFGTPAYWRGHVYIGAAGDHVKMFAIDGDMLVNDPVSMSPASFDWPGVTASVSANGDRDGIVWVVDSGDTTSTPAVLYALDAADLSHVLYKSDGNPARTNATGFHRQRAATP